MEIEQVIKLIRAKCVEAGSQAAYAESVGISTAYLSDILNGKRAPGEAILKDLEIEKIIFYRHRHSLRG